MAETAPIAEYTRQILETAPPLDEQKRHALEFIFAGAVTE